MIFDTAKSKAANRSIGFVIPNELQQATLCFSPQPPLQSDDPTAFSLTPTAGRHNLAVSEKKEPRTVMSLLEWCDEGPAIVSVLASVEDAISTMLDKDVGAVAIIDEQGIVAGMFTERDVLAKFALSGRDAKTTPVRELMSPMVEMATEETTAAEAFKVMMERHYRHLPVVDSRGKVLGILSIRNILESRIDDLLAELESKSHIHLT